MGGRGHGSRWGNRLFDGPVIYNRRSRNVVRQTIMLWPISVRNSGPDCEPGVASMPFEERRILYGASGFSEEGCTVPALRRL